MEAECGDFELQELSMYEIVKRNCVSDVDDDENEEFSTQEFSTRLKRKRTLSTRDHWRQAVDKALHLADPWEQFHLDQLECETAKRYRYNALKKTWVTDNIKVKMSNESFSRGAMRECFRIKKLSNFTHNYDWKSASNYVSKRYMSPVSRDVFLEDVKLQMEAKLWSEEYNRCQPPKKVDIMQVCVIEFSGRSGSPLYHLEHFIEGNYVKYNSNSGFISCENVRLTPQAFSHFTFEKSGHDLIVVDVQGVEDLYTDPQIHTACGEGYGEGNLGTRGMALFFKSHVCNHICRALNLSPFDLAPLEVTANHKVFDLLKSCKTQVRRKDPDKRPIPFNRLRSQTSLDSTGSTHQDDESGDDLRLSTSSADSGLSFPEMQKIRVRYESESSFENTDEDRSAFQERLYRMSRPSCVNLDEDAILEKVLEDDQDTECLVLGQIHMDLVNYYDQGRFCPLDDETDQIGLDKTGDSKNAIFHLQKAADCGCLEGIIILAQMHLGLGGEHLTELGPLPLVPDIDKGIELLTIGANRGDRASALHLAKSFDTGNGLGKIRTRSWSDAVEWYDRAINPDLSAEADNSLNDPDYILLARQAQMYREGGYGLDKDTQLAGDLYTKAGELAMAAMKGRMANQYYSLAEEVYAEESQ